MNQTEKIERLTETVQMLTETMAINEKRHRRTERTFRHMTWGFLLLALVTLLPRMEWINESRASIGSGSNGGFLSLFEEEHISQIFTILKDVGILTSRLKQDSDLMRTFAVVQTEAMKNPEAAARDNRPMAQKIVARYQQLMTDPAKADQIFASAGTSPVISMVGMFGQINFKPFLQGLDNMITLTNRIKQDSDVLRAYMLRLDRVGVDRNGIARDPSSRPIQLMLESQHLDLDSVNASPAMGIHGAREALKKMGYSLDVMTYSIGSTMGRMGSWIPSFMP